jgi:predicted nucleic acid-binding protein
MNLYLDSSAWVKLYVAEPGQPEFIQAVSHANLLVSHLIAYAPAWLNDLSAEIESLSQTCALGTLPHLW